MKKIKYRILFTLLWFFLFHLVILTSMNKAHAQYAPLATVDSVDLTRYIGKWYEIASFPQVFQKGCYCTTAEYSVHKKGYIIVENRCKKGSVNGKPSYAKGKAFIQKNSGNAKLKVQFFWPFLGDYWIIDLADDYSYAVIGNESRKYLWILSRTPKMDPAIYDAILERLKSKQFDVTQLKITEQV